ncbi:MAG: 50S ribosomal protein L18 [Hyphomicrobiales bacterium]|nr:50S ribosomal protein L18 [Hyphomicrobiales bacterium]
MSERFETVARRATRVRTKLRRGNKEGRLRLSVFRSSKYIYAQIIDDARGCTLHSASSLESAFREQRGEGSSCDKEAARKVGEMVARRALEGGVKRVVFDRGGYAFHGRVLALAQGAREAGLEF